MINVITCVATYDGNNILDFLNSYNMCSKGNIDHKLLILQTGMNETLAQMQASFYHGFFASKTIPPKKRMYASVIYEKIKLIKSYCNDDTIFINLDEDYSFNPFYIQFVQKIMDENPNVNYMSCLRGPGVVVEDKDLAALSGFRFFQWKSCMGGSMVTRWKTFYPAIKDFFDKNGVTGDDSGSGGMFDSIFWKQYLGDDFVYTTHDFSLLQHCRLGSIYRADGVLSPVSHMYAVNFDPRMNVFEYAI